MPLSQNMLSTAQIDEMLATLRVSDRTKAREPGWLWLNVSDQGAAIAERSGVQPSHKVYGELLEVRITPAVSAVLGEMIYGNDPKTDLDSHYYLQVIENRRFFVRYQQIIGSREAGEFSPQQYETVIERSAQLVAEKHGVVRQASIAAAEKALEGAGSWKAGRELDAEMASQLGLLTVNVEQRRILLPKEHLSKYPAIKKLLETAGGTYSSKGWFQYREGIDVQEVLHRLQDGERANGKKDAQFFATPAPVAREVVESVGPLAGKRVLEPSAGDGALADVAKAAGAADIVTIENWNVNAIALRSKGYEPLERDFLSVTPAEVGAFDAICMNPPFTKRQDIAHVKHALSFLAPDGKLTAIMSPSFEHLQMKDAAKFRELLEFAEVQPEPIEEGAFKESGTGIRTVKVSFDMADLRQRFLESGRDPAEFGLKLQLDAQHEAEEVIERARARG